MKIEIWDKGTSQQIIVVRAIQDDMGHSEKIGFFQQPCGDVIIRFETDQHVYSMEFCSGNGGSRHPIIAKKLRELIAELVKGEK